MRTNRIWLLALVIAPVAALFTPVAFAQLTPSVTPQSYSLAGWFDGSLSVSDVIFNIVETLIGTAQVTLSAVFVIGAFVYITSAGAEDRKGLGKGMMMAAVWGVVVIACARLIMNTTLYFIYNAPIA